MTFSDFDSFASWCRGLQDVSTKEHSDGIIISDLWSTPGMIISEVIITAYDSGLYCAYMNSESDNGSILIAET